MKSSETLTWVIAIVHGCYGKALIKAAEQIVGPIPITVAEIIPEEPVARLRQRIAAVIEERDPKGQEVLILTDLCGSTPTNICLSLLDQHPKYELITGLNFAMLMKLSTCSRSLGAKQMAQELKNSSQRSIVLGSDLLLNKKGGACDD